MRVWKKVWNISLTILSGAKAGSDSDEDEEEDSDAHSEDDDIIDNDDDDISEDFNDDAAEDFDENALEDDDDLQDWSDIDLADADDEDLSDMEFNDSEDEEGLDDELVTDLNKKLNAKGPKSKEKKKGKGIDSNIFVSAEKFAEMLEEQGRTKRKHGSSNTFSINDGASDKQIDWEMKRHQRLRGGPFGKKRKQFESSNNKQGKRFKR